VFPPGTAVVTDYKTTWVVTMAGREYLDGPPIADMRASFAAAAGIPTTGPYAPSISVDFLDASRRKLTAEEVAKLDTDPSHRRLQTPAGGEWAQLTISYISADEGSQYSTLQDARAVAGTASTMAATLGYDSSVNLSFDMDDVSLEKVVRPESSPLPQASPTPGRRMEFEDVELMAMPAPEPIKV